METILFQLQSELSSYNGKLKEIGRRNGQNINVTCPCNEHKGGFERHPSCQIFADRIRDRSVHAAQEFRDEFLAARERCERLDLAEAEELKKKLEEAGATVELK